MEQGIDSSLAGRQVPTSVTFVTRLHYSCHVLSLTACHMQHVPNLHVGLSLIAWHTDRTERGARVGREANRSIAGGANQQQQQRRLIRLHLPRRKRLHLHNMATLIRI